MALHNECVLHSPRLAIFHGPSFTDGPFLESLLDALITTSTKDWEIAFPKYDLATPGVLERKTRRLNQFTAPFVCSPLDKRQRLETYVQMAQYVTHVIFLRDTRDAVLEQALTQCRDHNHHLRLINVWE